jgi:hypothetical protein
VTDTTTGQQECVASNDPGAGSTSGSSVSLGAGFGTVNSSPQQSTGTGWLSRLTGWFASAFNAFFAAIAQFLRDMVISIFTNLMHLVVLMISAIPVPSWMKNYSMSALLGSAGPIVGFFAMQLQVPAALGLIGLGYVFRLARKFLTFFQW